MCQVTIGHQAPIVILRLKPGQIAAQFGFIQVLSEVMSCCEYCFESLTYCHILDFRKKWVTTLSPKNQLIGEEHLGTQGICHAASSLWCGISF